MDIEFQTAKLARLCNLEREATRALGPQNARKLRQRLVELAAAVTLADVFSLPAAGCHELKGSRKGQFAVSLQGGFRLVFVPANDPMPKKPDGGVDLSQVTHICVIYVGDYHE